MSFDKTVIAETYPEAEDLMIEPMLVWKLPAGKEEKLSEICSSGEYFLEEKIDGAFYQFVKTPNYSYLFGRTVSKKNGLLTEKIENVPHIKDALSCLPANTILIGEIYIPGGTSKNVVSIMGCLPQKAIERQKNDPIHYYIHDIIFYDNEDLMSLGAEDRYNILKEMWDKYNLSQYNFLRLATKITDNMEEEISNILNKGGEGAVLKKKDYVYVPGKRPAWSTIKIKQMDSIDLVCMGFCDPTKEYTGKEINTWEYWEDLAGNFYQGRYLDDNGNATIKIPMIPVTKYYFYGWNSAIKIGAFDDDNNLVELGTVSSGLTDEIKQDMSEHSDKYLHKVCSLDCMSIDKGSKTLRHPVFKAWRNDKNPEDCKISEVFV